MLSAHGKDASHQGQHHTNQTTVAPARWETDEDGSTGVPDGYCKIFDEFGCEAFENVTTITQENTFESQCLVEDSGRQENELYRWIRLQAQPDGVLRKEINSQQDVWNRIKQVKDFQSQYGPSDLYHRSWQPAKSNSISNLLTKIPLLNNNNKKKRSSQEEHIFSVMQFNALAEGLSAGPSKKCPFRIESSSEEGTSSVNTYGGFTKIEHPEIALDFDLRRWRLLEVLLGGYDGDESNANGLQLFDLIAMEEVDRYGGFFAPVLSLFGYKGIYAPKPLAPGVRLGWYSDGCALFFREDSFELVSEEKFKYRVGKQVAIVATFKHVASGRLVVVAVTHLKAQKSERNEKIRAAQISELLEQVEAAVVQAQEQRKEEVPAVIMGDLNADPPPVISDGCVKAVLSKRPLRFRPAYPINPSRPGSFTTWKTRGDTTVKRCIDYIFFSRGLRPTQTLNMPDEKDLESDGYLPGLRYPSDHMSIAAKFELYNE